MATIDDLMNKCQVQETEIKRLMAELREAARVNASLHEGLQNAWNRIAALKEERDGHH
jgi:hypothetical protein